jgi:hypothetical protein
MPSRKKTSSRWTPEARRALSTLQEHVCRRLDVDPTIWGTPEPVDLLGMKTELADAGDQRDWEALRDAAELYEARGKKPPKPPTRFESPHWHHLTSLYCAQIERAARSLRMGLSAPPLFGTLPVGSMNAFALRVRGTTITLFHVGMFNFLNQISKVVALAVPLEGEATRRSAAARPGAPRARRRVAGRRRSGSPPPKTFVLAARAAADRLSARPEVGRRFQNVVEAYLVEGDPLASRRFVVSGARQLLVHQLLTSAELFVLSHEYGHVILGHLEGRRGRRTSLAHREVRTLPYGWEEEYAADIKGLELTIETMKQCGLALLPASVLGVGLFFAAAITAERIRDGLRTGSFELEDALSRRSSHPPMLARLIHLQDSLGRAGGIQKQAAELMELPFTLLTMLFQATRPHWEALHVGGTRPAPIWNV